MNSDKWLLKGRRAPKTEWGWQWKGGTRTLERKWERERQVDLFKEWGVGESNFNGFWACKPFSLPLQFCPSHFPCVFPSYFPFFSLSLHPPPLRNTLCDGHSQTQAFFFLTDKSALISLWHANQGALHAQWDKVNDRKIKRGRGGDLPSRVAACMMSRQYLLH